MGFMAGITSDYSFTATADGEAITAEMVPELARQSFPLCMRNMQETLKTAKHLKHEGRQQYTLFLKVSMKWNDIALFLLLMLSIHLRRALVFRLKKRSFSGGNHSQAFQTTSSRRSISTTFVTDMVSKVVGRITVRKRSS